MKKEIFKDTKNIVILVLILVILGELVWATRFLSRPLPIPRLKRKAPEVKPQASLVLSPAKGTFKKGEAFEVEIKLETGKNVRTSAADLILSFDPVILEGVQIKNENLYPLAMLNLVDNKEGEIKFSAARQLTGAEIKNGGTLATITFKALKKGTAKVSFGFTPGSTTDSNVAQAGRGDILTRVVDGEYLIE